MPTNNHDNWITCEESKQLVHQWRAQEQAILIGYNTALADNPLLTTRLAEGNNPIRLVLDEKLELHHTLNVFNSYAKTIVFNALRNDIKNNILYIKIDFTDLINKIMHQCFLQNISSIIVEGGTKTINHFVEKNVWDEARVFVNPNLNFNTGIKAPNLLLKNKTATQVDSDLLYTFKNT